MASVPSRGSQALPGLSEALPNNSNKGETTKTALEAGRLSPVFDRKDNDRPGKMEGLNPERARRLLEPRSPSLPPINASAGPQKTGSNNVALGKPGAHKSAAQKLTSIKKECSTLANEKAQPPLVRPSNVLSVIAGAKRPRDQPDETQEPHPRRQCRSCPPIVLPRK
ncbi:hypothetical protein ACQKWADRAFT_265906 [Trichoderma austrokoningii]